MKFETAEELLDFITGNIKTSYKERYTGKPELSPKSKTGKGIRTIKFKTPYRAGLHDSMLELFKFKRIKYTTRLISSIQSNLEIIEIELKNEKVRILIKPKSGREWRQQSYWNQKLETLDNWRQIKGYPDTQIEFSILSIINKKIEELGNLKPVKLRIKSQIYNDVIGFVPGSSGAKADFVGINSKGKSIIFISHKDGRRAKDFQQYSGLSSRSGGSIYDHPEVKSFREDIAKKETSDFYRQAYRSAFYREIKDKQLKQKAIFGKDYGSGTKNENNISLFAQGEPLLIKTGPKNITLSFKSKIVEGTQVSQLEREGYNPVLGARKGEAYRAVEYKGDKVTGVRGGIFSKEYIEGRNSEPI
jgi:hypothetical protein